MSHVLNAIQCATNLKNTGVCDCPFDPKLIIGKIMIPKSRVLTQAEVDDIQATLEDLVQVAKANRIFPVQKLVAVTDSSEEPTFKTFGYGSQVPVREGKYNWTFEFVEGGVPLNNALRSFNGSSSKYAELYIESSNVLIGTSKKDANGEDGLAGVPQEGGYPYTYPWKVANGTDPASYRTQSQFQPVYINDNIAFVQIPTTTYLLSELAGLQDVTLKIVATNDADDELTIKAYDACKKDMYDDFSDELEEVTAWIGADADGTTIAKTVAKDDAAKGWVITYSSADLTEGDTWTLAAPTVLAVAPITMPGYESNTVTVAAGS